MRIRSTAALLAMTMLAAGGLSASRSSVFNFVSHDEAKRAAAEQIISTPARAWMWSNDTVYKPGDQLTAWWTVKPNSDLYPVTIVAYRVNNQTGEKTYLPAGTTELTDVFGNTPAQGFEITRWPNATKSALIGNGGLIPALTIPNELGMHTLIVEFRDFTGKTVIKRLYQKISVVDQFVTVNEPIEADTTWVRTKSYVLGATIIVRNATLAIESGTIIRGNPGTTAAAALIIRNDSKLIARGTKSRPIIFTSALAPGLRQPGDIAGVALLGTAPVNTGTDNLEGLPAGPDTVFGGSDPNHSCGELTYVRVEFAGRELSPDNELNAFTFAGCGKGTVANHLQAHYGFDDLFEWFGGTNDVQYIVGTAGRDDGFDLQKGTTSRAQHYIVVYYPDNPHDKGIEADNLVDNNSATPFSNPQLWNATFVGAGSACRTDDCEGARLRRGLKGSFNNIVFTNFWSWAWGVRDAVTEDNVRNNELTANGIVVWNNNLKRNGANTLEGQFPQGISRDWAAGTVGTARNVVVANPMFRSLVPSDWDLRPAPGSPLSGSRWALPPNDGFFDQSVDSNCAGAICGGYDWTEEWTNKRMESDLRQ